MRKLMLLIMALFMFVSTATADIPVHERRTLHGRYDPERYISESQITELLNAGFSMPTGGNQRALEFFVVTDRETMSVMKGGNPYSQALDSVPCVIVIAANLNSAYYEELLEMDAGIAAGGILIQAADLGITTCVLSIAPQQERIQAVRTALGMGENLVPILMIAAGYPEEDAVTGASVNNWDDSQVHWERQE